MDEGEDGEEDAPYQGERDAHQGRQQPVAPVFGYCEGGEARFPHAVKAVGAGRLGDHVLKVHLEMKGILALYNFVSNCTILYWYNQNKTIFILHNWFLTIPYFTLS